MRRLNSVVIGDMTPGRCGAPPLCQVVCGFSVAANDGGIDHHENGDVQAPPDLGDAHEADSLDATLPDLASERPLVACGDSPATGDRCDPLPSGVLCREGEMCGGGCAPECSCVAGLWTCERLVCRDYFVQTDGGMAVAPCGTPPFCRVVCGS